MPFEVISWNVNGIRACSKKGLFKFAEKVKPDILCVQETKARVEQFEETKRPRMFVKEVWHSAEKAGYSGLANFYKKDSWDTQIGMGMEKFDREGRVPREPVGSHGHKFAW